MMQKYCSCCFQPVNEADRLCPACGNPVEPETPCRLLRPGTLLKDRYYIGKVLGEGGFGVTYAGFDVLRQRRVAVKEYFPHGIVDRDRSESPDLVPAAGKEEKDYFEKGKQRFLKEAEALAGFEETDGLVRVLDYFPANNTACLVMEYLEGISLKQYLASCEQIAVVDALNLLMPVVEALQQLHAEGLVHGDVSPDNLLLVRRGGRVTAKLIDFSAARENASVSGKTVAMLRRYGYAPAEQYGAAADRGPWTDVYGLCATVYHCITGTRPPMAAERMREDYLPRPSALGVSIDAHTESVLLKGLSVSAGDRYATVGELLRDLLEPSAEDPVPEDPVTEELVTEDPVPEETVPEETIPEENIPEETVPEEHAAEETDAEKRFPEGSSSGSPGADEVTPVTPAVGGKAPPSRSRKKRPARIIVCALAGAALAALAVLLVMPGIRYAAAARRLERQDYDGAVTGFSALGDYRDAAAMADEARYQKAVSLMEEGSYAEAAPVFERLEDYKDSRANGRTCRAEETFSRALEDFNNRRYEAAASGFASIRGEKKEAGDYIDQAYYYDAKEKFDRGDYKGAAEQFAKAGAYEDAEALRQEACYQYGWECYEKQDYRSAYDYLTKVSAYKDVPERYGEVCYRYGCRLLEEGSWLNAVNVLSPLGDYADCREKTAAARYAYVSDNRDRFNPTTYQYLSELMKTGYKDSGEIYRSLYGWRLTIIINNQENDDVTPSDVDRTETAYAHIHCAGGAPGEDLKIRIETTWPNGSLTEQNIDVVLRDGDSRYAPYALEEPSRWSPGKLTVRVFNAATGELIGEGEGNFV